MLLSSSLEPNGPRSTGHYLVLCRKSRRDLISLPASYSELEKIVEKLYDLKSDQFHIETKDLNLSPGETVRISKDLWNGVAQFIGSVSVVHNEPESHTSKSDSQTVIPSKTDAQTEVSSESDAQPVVYSESQSPSNPTYTATQSVIKLETPLVKGEVLVIHLGKIDFNAYILASTKFSVRLLDEQDDSILSISMFPLTGSIFLSSATTDTGLTRPLVGAFPLSNNHNIVLLKLETMFQVLFDLQLIGTVQIPANTTQTSLWYDLGSRSPFKGPLSAQVYNGLAQLRENASSYHAVFQPIDKETLYQRISICDPRDSAYVSGALASMRGESSLFQHSNSWTGTGLIHQKATDLEWHIGRHFLYVIRFTLPEGSLTKANFILLGKTTNYALRIEMKSDNNVIFSENSIGNHEYHSIKLVDSIHVPGEHTIASTNQGGKIQVIFDFKQSTVLPRTTLLDQKTRGVFTSMAPKTLLVADIYNFAP